MKIDIIFIVGTIVKTILVVYAGGMQDYFLMEIFNGLPFHQTVYGISLFFFEYMLYSFSFFGDAIQYITNGGIYVLVREKSRRSMVIGIIKNVMTKLFFMKLYEVICFLIINRMLGNNCLLGGYKDFIFSFSKDYIIFCILLLNQLWIELYFNSFRAVIISSFYFIISIIVGNCVFDYCNSEFLYCLFFLNLAYDSRYDLIKNGGVCMIVVMLVSAIFNAYLINRFDRKDLLWGE